MIAFKLGSPDSHMRDGEASSRVSYSYLSTFSSCFYLEYKGILYTLSFEVRGAGESYCYQNHLKTTRLEDK